MLTQLQAAFLLIGVFLLAIAYMVITWPSHVVKFQPEAGKSWISSLGLRFVPAGTDGVLMSVYDVRLEDFKAFMDASGYQIPPGIDSQEVISVAEGIESKYVERKEANWDNPGFPQFPDSPVVGVNWNDAQAFCDWLTKKEQASGRLAADQCYRLPFDQEWSRAAGSSRYPWGSDKWPPPAGTGNFGDKAWLATFKLSSEPDHILFTGNDGYANTSPVGQFKENAFGLFDMAGNVHQWCKDTFDIAMNSDDRFYMFTPQKGLEYKVLRGSSWADLDEDSTSSCRRRPGDSTMRSDTAGFRLALVVSPSQALASNPQPIYTTPAPTPISSIPGISITGKLDRDQIYAGESFTITIVVSGCSDAAIDFPKDVASLEETCRMNGIASDEKPKSYGELTLIPHQVGKVIIPPILISVHGKSVSFHQFTLNVLPSTGPPRPPSNDPMTLPPGTPAPPSYPVPAN